MAQALTDSVEDSRNFPSTERMADILGNALDEELSRRVEIECEQRVREALQWSLERRPGVRIG